MSALFSQISFFAGLLVFMSVSLMHLVRKDATAVKFYLVQSAAIVILLSLESFNKLSLLMIVTIAATIVVKILMAPAFFFRLIKKHDLNFSVPTHLNGWLSLASIVAILVLTQIFYAQLPALLAPLGRNFFLISASSIMVSLFLLINRKGALSQILGILSLENSIVSFAVFTGLEQNPSLQLGIIFDILIWVIIASVFASMIFAHFGSLDVTEMSELTD
jgi:hydrogenase-4 component E